MIIINIRELAPSEIEMLLTLWGENRAIMTAFDAEELKRAYIAICGEDEMDKFLSKLDGNKAK